MADLLWAELKDKLSSTALKWPSYAGFATFILYLLGYLTLRGQLGVYGVVTLDAFDERYFFAGGRFLFFLSQSIPGVLALLALLAGIAYLPYKLIPGSVKAWVKRTSGAWIMKPGRLPLLGGLLTLMFVQLLLTRCLSLGNLLLADSLPDDWISTVLLSDGLERGLYLAGLVGAAFFSGALLLITAGAASSVTTRSRVLVTLLAFLVGIEFLLLPVNYGALILSQRLARVAELGGGPKLLEGDRAWLVWETKEEMTYLVQASGGGRTLIRTPRKDATLKIVGYDQIFRVLFPRPTD